jgi:hypothetical protein
LKPRRPLLRALAALLILSAGAPTVGDLGSCGQDAVLLDTNKFFEQKEAIDCQKCTDCAIFTKACDKACDNKLDVVPFPKDCFPLVHDGEVCVHALEASKCGDYETFMADEGALIPNECDFCPADKMPSGGGGGAAP